MTQIAASYSKNFYLNRVLCMFNLVVFLPPSLSGSQRTATFKDICVKVPGKWSEGHANKQEISNTR